MKVFGDGFGVGEVFVCAGGGRGRRSGRDEEAGQGGDRGDDTDIKDHLWNLGRVICPEWVDKLAESGAEGVREACNRGSGGTSGVTEPDVRVAGWRAEDEGLS